jgi:hypothetical protein
MQQCQIYDNSLRFSRATYGILVLIAFFIHSQWLVLAVAILVAVGAYFTKLNIPYQLHAKFAKKSNPLPVQRESAELKFVASATAILLLIGFMFLYFGKTEIGWVFTLVVDLLIFLACFVGFCVATMMYVLLKKMFKLK